MIIRHFGNNPQALVLLFACTLSFAILSASYAQYHPAINVKTAANTLAEA